MNPRTLRWLPAAAVPVVVVAAALAVPAIAASPPNLPGKSAQEILELVAGSRDTAYSGTVEQSSDLGIPALPEAGPGGGGTDGSDAVSSALELLTGSHEARVYVGGRDTARIQLMETLAERDVVHNGSSVWFYDSAENTAVHVTLPDGDPATLPPLPTDADTPAELAQRLIDAVEPSTTITVGDTARIAGRAAYTVTLTPDSDTTLVGSASLSVDAETGLPLAASIASSAGAADDSPAFSVAFTDIDFTAPDASLFDFTPPAGAEVTEKSVDDAHTGSGDAAAEPHASGGPATSPSIIGSGWDTIVEVPADGMTPTATPGDGAGSDDTGSDDTGSADTGAANDAATLLDQLTTEVPGGRVLETTLVSVLVTTDGRVFAGAVPAEQLQAAALAP
jgi:outer membrane lipoprotein-sorting protein